MGLRKWVAAASATAFVLAASGCGDSTKGASGSDKPTINLVQNSWTASALNVQIAKQLIEKQLGNTVKLVTIDENQQFAGLAKGDLDATLEIWPSGVTAKEKAVFDDKSVTDIGKLGVVGKIGWFVPDYVVEKYPALTTWEGLKDPVTAKAFATAETGSKGRFLGVDPSYSQYDKTIIDKLGLPFEVVMSGSEAAAVAELDSRVAKKEPILMYWWTPTAAAAKYKLKNVTLPKYTEDCYKDPAQVACDYPEDQLYKAASAKLKAKDAKVYAFLEKLHLTNEDQLAMLPKAEIDKQDPAAVAADWIESHEAVWRAWL